MKYMFLTAAFIAQAGAFDLIGVDTLDTFDTSDARVRAWSWMSEFHGKLLIRGYPNINTNLPGHRDIYVELDPSDTGFSISSLPRKHWYTDSRTPLQKSSGRYFMISHNFHRLDSGAFRDSGTYLLDMTDIDAVKLVKKVDASWSSYNSTVWIDTGFLQVNELDSGKYRFQEFNLEGVLQWEANHRFQTKVFTSDTGGRMENFHFIEAKRFPDGGLVMVGYFGETKTSGLIKLKPGGELDFIRYFDASKIKSYQYLTDGFTSVQVTNRNEILCFGMSGSALVMHKYSATGDSLQYASISQYNPLFVRSFEYEGRYHVSVRDWHDITDYIVDDRLRIFHSDTLDLRKHDDDDIGGMSQVLIGKTLFRLVSTGYNERRYFTLWKKRLPDLVPVSAGSRSKRRIRKPIRMEHNVLGQTIRNPATGFPKD